MTLHLIAEIGVNYQSINEAISMIYKAKEAGASEVKFQLFNKNTIKGSPLEKTLTEYILTEEQIKQLRAAADKAEIGFILTPMYLEAVDLAAKYADYIKIRYKDHENKELIEKAYNTGKELLISVPRKPLNTFDPRLFYLYCLPQYPPATEDFDLDCACTCSGVSLHFPHTLFDLAFALCRFHQESFIEKHVMITDRPELKTNTPQGCYILSGVLPPPIDAPVSITFEELKSFINQLNLLERIPRTRI